MPIFIDGNQYSITSSTGTSVTWPTGTVTNGAVTYGSVYRYEPVDTLIERARALNEQGLAEDARRERLNAHA